MSRTKWNTRKSGRSLLCRLGEKHRTIMKVRLDFQRTFGIPLQNYYKDILTGFDMIAFDEFLQSKDEKYRKANTGELGGKANCSMKDHVVSKYGDAAFTMLKSLI